MFLKFFLTSSFTFVSSPMVVVVVVLVIFLKSAFLTSSFPSSSSNSARGHSSWPFSGYREAFISRSWTWWSDRWAVYGIHKGNIMRLNQPGFLLSLCHAISVSLRTTGFLLASHFFLFWLFLGWSWNWELWLPWSVSCRGVRKDCCPRNSWLIYFLWIFVSWLWFGDVFSTICISLSPIIAKMSFGRGCLLHSSIFQLFLCC